MKKTTIVVDGRTIFVDVLFGVIVLLVPVISHSLSFPLYLLDPMRWCVLGSYLLLCNKNNSILLAFVLPLISYAFSGHPILFKNILISVELIVNIVLLEFLLKRFENVFVSVLISILTSKLIYYLLKATIIYFGLLASNVFDTSLIIQIVVSVLVSIMFSKYCRR